VTDSQREHGTRTARDTSKGNRRHKKYTALFKSQKAVTDFGREHRTKAALQRAKQGTEGGNNAILDSKTPERDSCLTIPHVQLLISAHKQPLQVQLNVHYSFQTGRSPQMELQYLHISYGRLHVKSSCCHMAHRLRENA